MPSQVKAPPPVPDDLVIERFSNIMNPPAVPGVESSSPPPLVTAPPNIGDAILGVIRNQANGLQVSWKTVQDVLATQNLMTVTEMFRLQAAMIDFGLRYEVVGKGVSKAIQDLDQMVKMQ